MGHLPKLIEDLALILITGAITTLVFRWIRQPLVLGYILAGLLVGPHVSITPTIADHANIETLAEIGVIFLLFSLGLEFSFKKLMSVGGSASITALVEIIFITVTGFFIGRWMGWSKMDSLFLGGMLASSSTTIIIKAFDELGIKTKRFAGVVFGVLVVEDIVVILLMVLLSTMAVSKQFHGSELLFVVAKLGFFLLLWFIAGIFLLPTFLKRARKVLDNETLLVLSIGLCLGMVVLATQVGFSAELGAFIMGSILAETTSAEKVEHLINPVKNLFGAVFFVSVGMLIDPLAIWEYRWPVLAVTMLTIFGKLISTTLGALLSGQPLKQAVQVGMSMAQIGEFAFIVATLGLSLGVISDFLFPVAVGASAITTFTTPYMIRLSEPFYRLLVRVLPERWLKRLNSYSSGTLKIQAENTWRAVLRAYGMIVLSNGLILGAIFFVSLHFFVPFVKTHIADPFFADLISLTATLVVAFPFLWALMSKRLQSLAYKELWIDRKYIRGPLFVIELIRNLIGATILGFFVTKFYNPRIGLMVVLPIVIGAVYLLRKKVRRLYQRMEGRFLMNLNSREHAAAENDPLSAGLQEKNNLIQSSLNPWGAYITTMTVNQLAPFAGKSLADLTWREKYGINVAYIKRGGKIIHTPGALERLLPLDEVGIISTEEQIQAFKPVFEETENLNVNQVPLEHIVLQKVLVDENTRLKNVAIRDSRIRELTNGLIIGIERNSEWILNPESGMVIEWGDVIWIVGERKKIQNLRLQNKPSKPDRK